MGSWRFAVGKRSEVACLVEGFHAGLEPIHPQPLFSEESTELLGLQATLQASSDDSSWVGSTEVSVCESEEMCTGLPMQHTVLGASLGESSETAP